MKLFALTSALALVASASLAGPFGLPDHEPNGFRDTGCDEAARTEVRNDAGKLLYVLNPTCKQNLGFTSHRLVPTPGDDGILGTEDDGSKEVTDN